MEEAEVVILSTFEELEGELSIFPNPVSETFRLQLTMESIEQVIVSMLDLSGTEIQALIEGQLQTIDKDFDISGLKSGVYILRIEQEDGLFTRRIVMN